ncbi:MAG: hypothetical protein QX199_07895 [Methylococcaceae bacterium]
MLLKFEKNLLLMSTLFFLGYANILHADECGVLRHLANKSNGVSITGNTCKTVDDIAVGSEFNLMPGARLWFKSQEAVDAKKMQGICQNRSSKSIRISVDNNKLPWIKPNGLSNCSPWINNKINCDDNIGGQKALTCVLAAINSEPRPNELEERTTSVRMRSLPTTDDADETEPAQNDAEIEQGQIISAMQADIGLCKAIYQTDTSIKISWLVETDGRVKTVAPVANQSAAHKNADKPFIDCITAVIKDFPYPHVSQAIWLTNQF